MAAAPDVVETAELSAGRKIRMARTDRVADIKIILGLNILILEGDKKRGPRRPVVDEPAFDQRDIGFASSGRSRKPGFSLLKIRQKILRRERKPGRASVDKDSHFRAMGFAVHGDLK
jgi:hypothetical protein